MPKMIKPIIKWVGGKTQIINQVLSKFPTQMENYHEPFLGGGSVLFRLLELINEGEITVNNIYASDLNEALIYVYINIQNNFTELYKTISTFIKEFHETDTKEKYYYNIRKMYNELGDKQSVIASSLFIFLNKTCFRGLYRVGPNGFNVPYGNYKNPEIINLEHLQQIHELIQGVIFTVSDYSDSLKIVKNGDFVYLDPPYFPVKADSFVKYTPDGFNQHEKLFDSLKKAKYNYLMSNSEVEIIKQQFPNYEIIKAKRNINSKNPQQCINELFIFKIK